ncbi:MAG: BF3164 family lipoprotein, partial [Bacteroidales bacterium]|nr:BF3164 family lipoprotein [Bacteroidales bacterium]
LDGIELGPLCIYAEKKVCHTFYDENPPHWKFLAMRLICNIALLIITMPLFLSSCAKTEREVQHLLHETIALQPEELLGRPYQMAISGNCLILTDGASEQMFHLVDIDKEQYAGSVGKKGPGPLEFSHPQSLCIANGRFFIFDIGKYKAFEIFPDTDVKKVKITETGDFQDTHSAIIPLGSGQYATCGLYRDGWVKLLDARQNVVASSDDCPCDENDKDIPNLDRSFAYQGTLVYNGDDKLVMGTFYAKQLYVFKIEHGTLKCESSLVQSYPLYRDNSADLQKETGREAYGVAFDKENKMGYVKLYAAPDKIYALYSGSSIKEQTDAHRNIGEGSELIVYNYDLKELASYKLDVPLRTFTLDEKTNTIYGIGYLPEATLVKFKLP